MAAPTGAENGLAVHLGRMDASQLRSPDADDADYPETDVDAAVAGVVAATESSAAATRKRDEPGAAAQDTARSRLRTLRILPRALFVIVRGVPVGAPLPHVAVHVIQA